MIRSDLGRQPQPQQCGESKKLARNPGEISGSASPGGMVESTKSQSVLRDILRILEPSQDPAWTFSIFLGFCTYCQYATFFPVTEFTVRVSLCWIPCILNLCFGPNYVGSRASCQGTSLQLKGTVTFISTPHAIPRRA